MKHEVLLFYKYTFIKDPQKVADFVRDLSIKLGLLGRVIIATEGINATLEGTKENAQIFIDQFLKDERFKDIEIKRSASEGKSFPKLSVKVREEIVGTHFPKTVNPCDKTGKYLKPEELKGWFEEKEDFVIVDMRNDYEFALGHFKNSIEAGIEASRDLPEAISNLDSLKDKKILTVCTGGIRCEKMSAYLIHKGFKDVHQLDGGIHSYMEKYPGQDFLGGLYTFDQRVVMDFGGDREVIGVCKLCGDKTEEYVNCAKLGCHLHFLACLNCQREDGTYCLRCKESKEIKVLN